VDRLRSVRWAALLVGIALIAAACGGGGDEGGGAGGEVQTKEGGTLNFASDQEQAGFNINTSKDNLFALSNIITNVYPSVFNIHPDLVPKLNTELMDSAELTSQDPQTVVYKIKQEAVWSDGTPVSADDFIYFWENCNETNKKADCVSTAGYKDIESVKGSDGGKTVTTVYKKKFADWRSLFFQMVPAHYTKEQPGGWNTGLDKNPEKIPSAGPFVITSYTPGESLTLKRNDKFWGQKSHLDQIVFRYLPESNTQPPALQNNEVDMIYPQPQTDMVQVVKGIPDVHSEINFGLTYEHLDFNFKNELLADPAVRKAFATGLNIQQIVDRTVKQFSDKASVLGSRVWMSNQPEYQDNRGSYGNGDIAAAEKLLTDAGYTKGSDGIFAKGGKKLSFNISTTSGNALRESQEQIIQAQAKQFGMDIKIKNADADKLFGEWLPEGNYDIANFAWVGDPYAVSSNDPIFRTGSAQNYGSYSNPEVDKMFDQAVSELDAAKAAELVNQIDQKLWEDLPTIPLYQKPTFLAYDTGFVGIGDNTSEQGPFWNANTWGQKAA
jgi:peptide/nickel transport system substrate-binding protein